MGMRTCTESGLKKRKEEVIRRLEKRGKGAGCAMEEEPGTELNWSGKEILCEKLLWTRATLSNKR